MEIPIYSLQSLPRNNSCTNANYILARSCGNGEVKKANPPFVQSKNKAVRACKLFLLHHRRIVSAMEIRVNSLQSLAWNSSCTNANYILARSYRNWEAKKANPPFVQSKNKAVRACKFFLLPHRRIVSAMEIRVNSLQSLAWNSSCTNANYILARSCGNGEAKKSKSSLCAINAQNGTSLQIVPPAPSPHSIGNENSRKFPAKPSLKQ